MAPDDPDPERPYHDADGKPCTLLAVRTVSEIRRRYPAQPGNPCPEPGAVFVALTADPAAELSVRPQPDGTTVISVEDNYATARIELAPVDLEHLARELARLVFQRRAGGEDGQ